MWLCSNPSCPDKTKLSEGSVCSSCGTSAQLYGFRKSIQHLNAKDLAKNKPKKGPNIGGESKRSEKLLSPDMTDEDIQKLIQEDLQALSESHHLWASFVDLIDSNGEDQSPEAELLKTLIGQNRIIIRQNELILRAAARSRQIVSSTPRSKIGDRSSIIESS